MRNFLLLVIPLSGLIACSSDPDMKYLDARTTANLEIPPDLTQAKLNDKFEIPANFSSGLGETVNKIPVLAQVESIKLDGAADFYWLSIDGQIENLYETIKSFWGSEGFTLDIDEPVIGIMQTEWVLKEEGATNKDSGFFASFFADLFASHDFSASQDQYRTRIARDSDTSATRIYISHRGTQYEHKLVTRQNEDDEPNNWAFRAPEPELEIEMLSRLMVYLGLEEADVGQQVSAVKMFQPRVSIHTDNSENETYLLVRAVQKQTWNRLLHELDRLDIEVVRANPTSGLSGDGVIQVKTIYETLEETGGFAAIFSSSEPRLVQKEVVLVVSEENHELTRISLKTPDGDVEESAEGLEFLTMLFDHIR